MSTLLHPSSIGLIMGDAKSIDPSLFTPDTLEISKKKVKTDDDKKRLEPLWDMTLSAGAKTYLKAIAREIIYCFEQEVDVKYMRKGKMCEQDAINLLNSVYFKNYVKHEGRVFTDLLSGECDILRPEYVRDTKTCWSLATFPVTVEDAESSLYEWQGRGYMHLYDRPLFYLDYCMVTTPADLRKYEQAELHEVDHIDPQLRVTTVMYERDMTLEQKMLVKCKAAQTYIEQIKRQIFIDHKI